MIETIIQYGLLILKWGAILYIGIFIFRLFSRKGTLKTYYDSKKIESITPYNKNLPYGECITYYENGNIKTKEHRTIIEIQKFGKKCRRSVLDGEKITFSEKGEIEFRSIGSYRNNREIVKTYQILSSHQHNIKNNLQPREEVLISESIFNYDDDILETKSYFSNGVQKSIVRIEYDKSKIVDEHIKEDIKLFDEWGDLTEEKIYELGELVEHREYKRGKIRYENIRGVIKDYNANGCINTIRSYSNGVLNGVYQEYVNGRLFKKIIYEDGKRTKERTYFSNGNIWWEAPALNDDYSDEDRSGWERFFYKTGELHREIYLENGKKTGMETFYRTNGCIYKTIVYKNGVRNGIAKRYNQQNNLKVIVSYKNNEKNGVAISYSRNNHKIGRVPYKKGIIDGMAKTYYKNGNIKSEILFQDGMKEGITKTYYDDGSIKSESLFEYGIRINTKKYKKGTKLSSPCSL